MAQNTDEFLRGRGFDVKPHTAGQLVRDCTGTSYHCKNVATAVDYGDAQYSGPTLNAMYDALLPYAGGPGRIVEELAYGARSHDNGVPGGAWPNHWDHLHTALVPGRLLPVSAPPEPPKPPPAAADDLELIDG